MKILGLFLGADPRTQGGIQTFGRNLKKFYGEKITFLTNANSLKKIYDISNIDTIGFNNLFFKILNKILKNKLRKYLIIKKIQEQKYDIIILSFPHELELLKNVEAKKIVVQHFKFDYFLSDVEKIKKLKDILDYYVVLSPYDKIKFQEGFNIPEKKIKVIRHTCNIDILERKKEKNNRLVMIARIDNFQKRFDLAIKAMRKLPEFILDIYGEEHILGDIERLKNLMLEENITNVNFNGVTKNVKNKLDRSGIFIMTSDYEGYPIAVIEAMNRGLPIILRDTFDSAKDIIINNRNGILLNKEWNEDEFVEAVRKVYNSYEYYSENSKELGKRYNPEVIKKEWDKLFLELKNEEK